MIFSPETRIITALLLAVLWTVLPAAPARSADEEGHDTFSVYWENDFFAGTDRDYTNGVKLSWSTPYRGDRADTGILRWSSPLINRLPFLSATGARRTLSLSLGQNIYTPADISRADPDPKDRPYAGITYLALGFHARTGTRRTSWEFDAGMIGPLSFAGHLQRFVHRAIDTPVARGWSHQLKNEPAFEVICETQWRIPRAGTKSGLVYDLIPHLGARAGNVMIYANTGAEVRLGWNLPRNFGTCPIRGGCETTLADTERDIGGAGFHIFAGVDGRVVLRDLFLDGNTFRRSPSVEKEPLVADIMAGIAGNYGRLKASYSYVLRTKQFRTQKHYQIFGAVNVSWAY